MANPGEYEYIIDAKHRWSAWAAPKKRDGSFDHDKALTGDDLIKYVDEKLFPYLKGFRTRAEPDRQPRILFLADRNTLANQAYNDFTSFAAFEDKALARIKPDEIRRRGRVPKNASVFFTIFQTFMSGTDADGQPAPYYFGD